MRGGDGGEVRLRGRRGPSGWPPHMRPNAGGGPPPPPAVHHRFSGDFGPPTNNLNPARFRRARSSEWDREALGVMSRDSEGSSMRTLDKRVSVSSEQLDSVGEVWGRPALQPARRTPFEMFLEDDGPYSRKLYGPVGGSRVERRPARPEKVVMRNLVTEVEEEPAPELGRGSAVKKGLLWQQRDRLFSRWKERFFVLTSDYFHCFRRGSQRQVTEMGEYIFKVRLTEINSLALLDKRGFLTVSVGLREGRIYLRRAEGLRDWYNVLQFTIGRARSRRATLYRDVGREEENEGGVVGAGPQGKAINRLSLVSDLLMTEAICSYSRGGEIGGRGEGGRGEDSGVESAHSLGGTRVSGSSSQSEGGGSQGENDGNTEAEAEQGETFNKNELLVCHL